ncbi:UNVERIFIED_CONTAM: hypothetical protein Sradi_4891900 [Sesamum radiatum]|uniref:Uncharacterized protein n=1 Tax=Sesamum radiatum TaxID=300843 RepID=A0AAW2MF47_SESRA
MSWLILGDLNYVKSLVEKQLGVPPTWYELKDFVDCFLTFGLHDAQTTGCYYTWYSNSDSNPIWCKLDQVLLNNDWIEAGLHCSTHFNSSGCLSDHSLDHPDFIATVEEKWRLNVEGKPQFSLCKKLKALKGSLKAFNNLHYNHISVLPCKMHRFISNLTPGIWPFGTRWGILGRETSSLPKGKDTSIIKRQRSTS